MANPFDNPTTIHDIQKFVGREEHLARINNCIRNKQSISLVGARRIGKTSLLTCLRNKTTQEKFSLDESCFRFFYLDLQERAMKAHLQLLEDINLVLRTERPGILKKGIFPQDDELIHRLKGFQQRNLHPVLLLDSFDEIARYERVDSAQFGVLRSLATNGQISYIIASVMPLAKIFRTAMPPEQMKSGPFYDIFKQIKLGPFNDKEARELLGRFSREAGLSFSKTEINWVVQKAGYHPYFLQHVAALLFEEKRVRGPKAPRLEDIEKEARRNLQNHFDDDWHIFDSKEQDHLRTEIQQKVHDHDEYAEFTSSSLFRDYLQDTGFLDIVPAITMNLNDLKKILSSLNDLKALGESTLIKMPLIVAQIKRQDVTTSMNKGKIVQIVLKEALENIGGEGKRSDDAPDWTHYNILYYRYFMRKHGMNQEQIAHRLHISARHYYRLLSEAVDRLWHILAEMEEFPEPGSDSGL